MRLLTSTILIQSLYILVTALWPIVNISSFMDVTGYKTDVWLVKTVGALLFPVGLTLFSFLFQSNDKRPALLLGGLTAAAFICIDFYYVSRQVISPVYLLDGLIEIIFLTAWTYLLLFRYSMLKKTTANLFQFTESVSRPFQG
jgi:hypothetical protein